MVLSPIAIGGGVFTHRPLMTTSVTIMASKLTISEVGYQLANMTKKTYFGKLVP